MKKIFKVKVPATTANLGPGFDCIGAALTLYNEVEVVLDDKKGVFAKIDIEGEGEYTLPRDKSNIIWQSMKEVFNAYGKEKAPIKNLYMRIVNNIPLAAGLGSSAAARLSGILIAYKILGRKVSPEEVLKFGVKFEGHPDNIVPALLGGMCVSAMVNKEVKYIKLKAPKMKVVLCVPYFELPTKKARAVLPKKVSFADAVFNSSRAMLMLAALQKQQFDFLGFSMDDRLHQPYRKKLVPGMSSVLESAKLSGAYGSALSGAGPSILAFSSINKAEKVGRSMMSAWKRRGINSRYFILDFDFQGAKIINK